ncbi:MAG: cytochrome c family protein [Sphingomonadales bacterium]
MDNRSNIIAMMGLGALIVALGGSIVAGDYFHSGRPEKMGYVVEGVEEVGGSSGPAAQVDIATLMPTADPAKGEEVFKKCASCHNATQGGANGIGPNLYATIGDEIGHGKGGFAFSDALKNKGGKWDFAAMSAWLTSPKAFAPGTKMSFAGLSKAEDRANVIAYLNKQGSNLPIPPAPAAGAAPANATEGNATAPADNAAVPEANAAAPAAAHK